MKSFISCTFLFLCLNEILFSQIQQKDSAFYHQSVNSIVAFYTKEAGTNRLFYNGSEYIPSPFSKEGIPFFESATPFEGSVFYDGNLYEHVKMQYDLTKDQLVAEGPTPDIYISLLPERVEYFILNQHTFIHFLPDKTTAAFMPSGYYEKLTTGKVILFAKREKKFQLSLNPEDKSSSHIQYNHYFLQNGTGYYIIKDKKNLLQLLNDEKDQLKKYIRDNKINFKREYEKSIISLVRYYLQLKN